jgi:hypothetical protein
VGVSLFLACLSAGISLYGAGQYFYSIWRGNTQPRTASWIAWMTANSVFTVVAFLEHAYLAAIINGLAAAANAAILGVSAIKRQGTPPKGSTDWSCLTAAIACLAILIIFPENKLLGALLAMLANATATWPTILHAWNRPREEAWQLFAANATAGALSMVGIILETGYTLATTAGPLMTIIGSSSLVLITLGRRFVARAEEEIVEELQKVEELFTPAPSKQPDEIDA